MLAGELFQSELESLFLEPPAEWKRIKLGTLSTVKSGGTPLRSKPAYWEGGDIPWYSSGELNNLYTADPDRYITSAGLGKSNAKLFPEGSLLIGMYDTAALKMSILDRSATFNQAIAGVEPRPDLNLQFLYHAINAHKPRLMKQRRGVRQKNLSLAKIKDITLDVPSLEVQNHVVQEISSFQRYVLSLTTHYQTQLTHLTELRQSLLERAFAGELV